MHPLSMKTQETNPLKRKGKTGSRKKLFSDVEKVLFRKKKNRLIHEGAAKKVNETEVGFVSSIFLRCKQDNSQRLILQLKKVQ